MTNVYEPPGSDGAHSSLLRVTVSADAERFEISSVSDGGLTIGSEGALSLPSFVIFRCQARWPASSRGAWAGRSAGLSVVA